jgi:hypothetical protein
VDAIAGGATITFDVVTDKDGADEVVSVELAGQRFETRVRASGPVIQASIPLITPACVPPYTTGVYQVVLRAETSGVISNPSTLQLSYQEPRPGHHK